MRAYIITADELRGVEESEYNKVEWNKTIDRYITKYSNVVFYRVPKGMYQYVRYYVEYTLPDGLRLLSTFSLSGSLTNGGFFMVHMVGVGPNDETLKDALNYLESGDVSKYEETVKMIESSGIVDILLQYMTNSKGQRVLFNTSDEARKEMIERSTKYGITFSKGL